MVHGVNNPLRFQVLEEIPKAPMQKTETQRTMLQ